MVSCLTSYPLDKLLDKLSAVGVIGPEHQLFPDYLRNRTQDVEFHGLSSNPKGMSIGVPQGSIIGPLLFILHVNDLPEATFECSILLYTLRIQFFVSVRPPKPLPLNETQ